MIKKVLSASLVGAMLMFSGCGDSEGESRMSNQQGLDQGDGSSAISNLGARDIATLNDGEKMMLASAYMSRAGLSLTDTLVLVTESSTDDGSGFSSFAEAIEDKKANNSNMLSDLDNAVKYYSAISSQVIPSSLNRNLDTSNIGERDMFLGIAYLTKATLVMGYLGDIKNLENDDDPQYKASACAIEKVYAGTNCDGATTTIGNDYVVTIIINGDSYYRLANSDKKHLYLTDYSKDTATPTPIKNADGNYTISGVLTDTLNNAFNRINRVAPDDAKDDVKEFKRDIMGVDATDAELAKDLNSTHISEFISNQN